MHLVKAVTVTLATLALIVCGYVAQTARPMPTASTYPASRASVCAAHAPRAGIPGRIRGIGASGLTWQYVDAGEARYFHISRCSVVIVGLNRYGQDSSLILTPRGRVVAQS